MELREWVELSLNAPGQKIMHSLIAAQDRYLEPVLGTQLYSELLDQKENDSLTYENDSLLGEIMPMLSHYFYTIYLPASSIYHTNKGALEYSDDHAQRLSSRRLEILIDQHISLAQRYERELIVFLNENKSDYPSWDESCYKKLSISTRIGVSKAKKRNKYGRDSIFP